MWNEIFQIISAERIAGCILKPPMFFGGAKRSETSKNKIVYVSRYFNL